MDEFQMASMYRTQLASAQREVKDGSGEEGGAVVSPASAGSTFVTYAAEGDVLLARGEAKKAIESYGRALDLYSFLGKWQRSPMAREVLVSRSKCWIILGYPEQALLDAERALILWDKDEHPDDDDDGIPSDYLSGVGGGTGKKSKSKVPPGSYVQPGVVVETAGEEEVEETRPPIIRDSYKGLLAKAEALYAATNFELAAVFFHRGNYERPDVQAFRLGVQKCRQAILNAIGDPDSHRLTMAGEDHFVREMKSRKEASSNVKKRSKNPAADPKLFNEGIKLLAPGAVLAKEAPVSRTAASFGDSSRPSTANSTGSLDNTSSWAALAVASSSSSPSGRGPSGPSGTRSGVSNAVPSLDLNTLSQRLHPELSQRRATSSARSALATESTRRPKTMAQLVEDESAKVNDPHVAREDRQLLGSLSEDKAYLAQLLLDNSFAPVLSKNADMTSTIADGINFLEARKEFWRQQKPIYQRKHERRQRQMSARGPRPTRPISSRSSAGSSVAGATGGRRTRPVRPANSASRTAGGLRSSRARPPVSARSAGGKPGRGRPRPLDETGSHSAATAVPGTGDKDAYFEATRYAIQTLENVNNALEYDSPELGLQLAKNFLARVGSMELADKPRILGNLYCSMGNTYLAMGKLTMAAIHHRKDLDISGAYGYADATLRALGNLGRTYRVMGDYPKAIHFFERQAEVASDPEDEGRAYVDIGRCYFEMGKYKDAIKAGDTALEHARGVQDVKGELRANLLLGQSLSRLDDPRSALPFYEEHIRLAAAKNLPVTQETEDEYTAVKAALDQAAAASAAASDDGGVSPADDEGDGGDAVSGGDGDEVVVDMVVEHHPAPPSEAAAPAPDSAIQSARRRRHHASKAY